MRPIPVSELAALIFDPHDQVRALAMVRAYFDDSGTHGESLITTISGFVAGEKTWTALEAAWDDVLSDYRNLYGVTWYHATDVANWKGEWAAAKLDDCRGAPSRFATVLSKQDVLPVWAAVVNEDFYRYATPEFLSRFPKPFDLCFHQAMEQLYRWAAGVDAPLVAPVIAHGDYVARVSAAHAQYRDFGDFSSRIGPLIVDSPRKLIPLQAADLLSLRILSLVAGYRISN